MLRSVPVLSVLAASGCSAVVPSSPAAAAATVHVAVAPSGTSVASSSSLDPALSAAPPAAEPDRSPVGRATNAMCRCYTWSLTGTHQPDPDPCGGGIRESVEETFVPECLRAHDPVEDCAGLIACVNLEPSGYAECAEGEAHSPTSTCGACRCVTADVQN